MTRVERHGCACPHCGRSVLAAAPQGWGRGSPCGESMAQMATYLRYVHAISYQRLRALFHDVFGLEISEGALGNLSRRVQGRLGGTLEEIPARAGEQGGDVGQDRGAGAGTQGWGVGLHRRGSGAARGGAEPGEAGAGGGAGRGAAGGVGGGPVRVAARARRARAGVPPTRTSCGTCSTRSTRRTRCSRPYMLAWLQRAIKVGQKRERVQDATLQRHRRDPRKRLEESLQLEPQQADGQRLRKGYAKCKEGLLVLVTDREVPFTNNESERALRPSVIFRKVTNGTRSEWGAEFFAAMRSVIGTGRLIGLSPFDAIVQTIDGRSILNPT